MTVEELDIIVNASIEKAVKEFEKLIPSIKQVAKQMSENINKTDLSGFTGKVQQAVKQVKQNMSSLKTSNDKNKLEIKVVTDEASKQITQLEKEIDSLQEKINARQMRLNITNNALDQIRNDTRQQVIKDMPDAGAKRTGQQVELRLANNNNYMELVKQSDKLNNEVIRYNTLLNSAKAKMAELGKGTLQIATKQNDATNIFNKFKTKLEQSKGFSKELKNSFSQMPKITQNINNNIKNISKNLKYGLTHVLRYAGALFSLRGIYSILSNSAQSWLSSQNTGAQQLSANINYMKYAMGSALAPVIQWVINLVYQLMRAIQMVAYALTSVNIFANASAKSYANMAGSAKKAKEETQQLAGVHGEINNIQENKNSDSGSGGGATPSFDLSQMNNTPNNILEALKNGDWHQVGVTLGQKLNEAMDSIPWEKIRNTAKKIGTNIASFLNGFIATTNWQQVGNTLAQGINTVIDFTYSFVSTFDWGNLRKSNWR